MERIEVASNGWAKEVEFKCKCDNQKVWTLVSTSVNTIATKLWAPQYQIVCPSWDCGLCYAYVQTSQQMEGRA